MPADFIFCSECGSSLHVSTFFCRQCGQPSCSRDCYSRHIARHAREQASEAGDPTESPHPESGQDR